MINQLTTIPVRRIRGGGRGLPPTGQNSTAEQRGPTVSPAFFSIPRSYRNVMRVTQAFFSITHDNLYLWGQCWATGTGSLGKEPPQAELPRRFGQRGAHTLL